MPGMKCIKSENPIRMAFSKTITNQRIEHDAAMTTLAFTKMQGLGNDFVVLDGIAQRVDLAPAQLKRLADRRYGVGCDQILVV
jgi:hypothetical protein